MLGKTAATIAAVYGVFAVKAVENKGVAEGAGAAIAADFIRFSGDGNGFGRQSWVSHSKIKALFTVWLLFSGTTMTINRNLIKAHDFTRP